jgi:altronate hydrolase
MTPILRLHSDDDVAVAIMPIAPGETLPGGAHAREAIAPGHKVALHDIPAGAVVRKYGQAIGAATRAIAAGEWVHVHNLGVGDITARVDIAAMIPGTSSAIPNMPRTFDGYLRADGRR